MNEGLGHMRLAGVWVTHELVVQLAETLTFAGFVDTAGRILRAHADELELRLTADDHEAILRALDDPPVGLEELRTALLPEHARRREIAW